jgi:hypothetical protein
MTFDQRNSLVIFCSHHRSAFASRAATDNDDVEMFHETRNYLVQKRLTRSRWFEKMHNKIWCSNPLGSLPPM